MNRELTDHELSQVAGGGALDNLRDWAANKMHELQVALAWSNAAQEAAAGGAKRATSGRIADNLV